MSVAYFSRRFATNGLGEYSPRSGKYRARHLRLLFGVPGVLVDNDATTEKILAMSDDVLDAASMVHKFNAKFLEILDQLDASITIIEAEAPQGSLLAAKNLSVKRTTAILRRRIVTGDSDPAIVAEIRKALMDMVALRQETGVTVERDEIERIEAAHPSSDPPPITEPLEHDPELNFNDFDDDAGTGGGYDWLIPRYIFDNDGIARRIVSRFRGSRPVERVSIQVEEVRGGTFGLLMRYDDTPRHGGRFHRHLPGWHEPGKIDDFLDDVPSQREPTAGDTGTIYYLGGRNIRLERRQPEMTMITIPGAVRTRPVASADDSFAADEILMLWVGDDPAKLFELVPGGKSFKAVEIAEDESLAVFDVYAGGNWDAMDEKPIGRFTVLRTATL